MCTSVVQKVGVHDAVGSQLDAPTAGCCWIGSLDFAGSRVGTHNVDGGLHGVRRIDGWNDSLGIVGCLCWDDRGTSDWHGAHGEAGCWGGAHDDAGWGDVHGEAGCWYGAHGTVGNGCWGGAHGYADCWGYAHGEAGYWVGAHDVAGC